MSTSISLSLNYSIHDYIHTSFCYLNKWWCSVSTGFPQTWSRKCLHAWFWYWHSILIFLWKHASWVWKGNEKVWGGNTLDYMPLYWLMHGLKLVASLFVFSIDSRMFLLSRAWKIGWHFSQCSAPRWTFLLPHSLTVLARCLTTETLIPSLHSSYFGVALNPWDYSWPTGLFLSAWWLAPETVPTSTSCPMFSTPHSTQAFPPSTGRGYGLLSNQPLHSTGYIGTGRGCRTPSSWTLHTMTTLSPQYLWGAHWWCPHQCCPSQHFPADPLYQDTEEGLPQLDSRAGITVTVQFHHYTRILVPNSWLILTTTITIPVSKWLGALSLAP